MNGPLSLPVRPFTILARRPGADNVMAFTFHETDPQTALDACMRLFRGEAMLPLGWLDGDAGGVVYSAERRQAQLDQAVSMGQAVMLEGDRYKVVVPGGLLQAKPRVEFADPSAMRDAAHAPQVPEAKRFNPFPDLEGWTVSGTDTYQPYTNGREFGNYRDEDTRPTSHQIDPTFAQAAERSA